MPYPDAEVIRRFGGSVADFFGREGWVVFVFGFHFEGGFHEALLDDGRGDGEELPVYMDAAGAADFPCDCAHGVFGFVDKETVQRAAIALHFFVGGRADGWIRDSGQSGRVRKWDDQDVGRAGERGEAGRGGEGPFGRC